MKRFLYGLLLLTSLIFASESEAACNRAVPASGSWAGAVQPDINSELGCLYDESVQILSSVSHSGTAYTASTNPPLPYYLAGQIYQLYPNVNSTAGDNLNISGLGPVALISNNGGAIGTNDFIAGSSYFVTYDGGTNQMRILTPLGSGAAAANSPYVTIGSVGSLSAERALTAGAMLSLVDAGANSTVTLAVNDAELLCIGGLTSAADKIPYFTGLGTCALADFSSAIRTMITTPSSANLRAWLNDDIGTGVLVFLGTPADDQVPVGDSASATTWRTLPDSDGATQKLQYDQATNAFIAGTDDDVPEVGDFGALVGGSGIDNNSGTLDLDLTEINSAIFGSGTFTTLAFDAGATDPTWTYVSNSVGLTNAATMIFGNASSLTTAGVAAGIQNDGIDAATASLSLNAFNTTDATAFGLNFFKSGAASIGTATVVASGEDLGRITWYGAQQTGTFATQNQAAGIRATVGGTVTSGAGADMPGSLIFCTTPDASGTCTDRLTIDAAGLATFTGNVTNGTANSTTTGTIELGAASDTTLARSGAGAITVEGVGVALNSTSLVHTASTIELGNASDTTLSRASAGVLAVEGVSIPNNNRAINTGTGLTGGGNLSADRTVAIDFTSTLAGNPALNANECVHTTTGAGGGFLCEGSVADTFEGNFKFPDVTGADSTQTMITDATAAGGDLTGTYPNPTVAANAVALTTDTTGNYAAGDAEAGNALTGDSATAFFSAGSLEDARMTLKTESICVAASDETTNLTTGVAKVTWRMPYAFTVTDVRGSLSTVATGASLLTVDVNEAGTTIISTKLTFDASESTTQTAATPRVISDSALADDAQVTVDIDQVGNTTPGRGLKVCLIGHQ